jgi:hypothetical protein
LDALVEALDQLARALPRESLKPFLPARGGTLSGEFEVRSADGHVRRMQQATLALPPPLGRAFAHLAPERNIAIDMGTHSLVLWAPQELIELQVGYRWHGFNGKRMHEWDERYVVFAEDGGDPVALRLDEQDGAVSLSHRGEGRHDFFEAAPDLAAFYEAIAIWLRTKATELLAAELRARFGEKSQDLWIWRELVSGVEARR